VDGLCLPEAGSECHCNPTAKEHVMSTTCYFANEHGSCPGKRYCSEDGLTPCNAPPAAAESCNGIDDDCDGEIDESGAVGCTGDWWEDNDGDGFGGEHIGCVCEVPAGALESGGDCYDDSAAMNPSLEEICDGVDNNCDGSVDEGLDDTDGDGIPDCCEPNDDGIPLEEDNCPSWSNPGQEDYDSDGVGDLCDLDDDNDGWDDTIDCQPLNAFINFESMEILDGIDNNCNGKVDEGYQDSNGDGVPDAVHLDWDEDFDGIHDSADNCPWDVNPDQESALPDGWGYACDDDDDQDGLVDEDDNCPLVANDEQLDSDLDGIGDACQDDWDGDGVDDEEDCAPGDPTVYPGNDEYCDWKDNDCDGEKNEGFPNVDGDWLTDCIDYHVDSDVDGVADNYDNCLDTPNPTQYDADDDGLGDACDPDADNDGFANELDCNPTDASIYPGAPEMCDGKDNDCDVAIDNGAGKTHCQDCDPCTADLCDLGQGGCKNVPVDCSPGYILGPFCDCVPCVPDCGDKECGDNGCGGMCGVCNSGCVCGDEGFCLGGC